MKHIKIKSSEVLHGGKTLDKEIKDINIRIGKIAPDGTKIATRESLGNVIIGDNINVNEKGVIDIPIAHPQDETYGLVTSEIYLDDWENYIQVAMSDDGKLGVPKALSGGEYGVVAANENISNWNSYVNVAIDNYGKLGVPKGNPEKYGVIKPNYNDFDLNCTAQIINEVKLLITKLNKGFTYSNTNKHISFVCITDTTSKREFINSIAHEAKHIMENICEEYNIPLKGEPSAYMIGEIVMNMFDVFKYLI